MTHAQPIQRIVDLLPADCNQFLGRDPQAAEAAAREALRRGDVAVLRATPGHFALIEAVGQTVRMARTLGRPLRYFLAKQAAGPALIIAQRIDEIAAWLQEHGYGDQFHPSYTRMVPAHHIIDLQLIGCPDPNPTATRFFSPERNQLPADLDAIGNRYVVAVAAALDSWLDTLADDEPIGLMFSGGIDSGALLVLLNHLLLARGQAPTRLKAMTLAVDGRASDAQQAVDFCNQLGLGMLLEVVEVSADQVDWREAIRVAEDYKPLDIQAAAMALALCREWRRRYPQWRYIVDGDGGDENLKDYPIEDNPELTIRSVLNNRMLYHEGWGVDAVKHSLTFSGGQSRGHQRTFTPAARFGFVGFSPYALPDVIEVAEGIPFIELTQWSHERLYALKGEVVRRGIRSVTGVDMPIFEKRRFQHGATGSDRFASLFPTAPAAYRRAFDEHFAAF